MYTHTQIPELKFFVIQLGANAPLGGSFGAHFGGASCENFPTFLPRKKRINLTVVAEIVCPVVTRLFEKNKSTIMKSEGRINIADKDKIRTKKKNKTSFLKTTTSYGNYYSKKTRT